MRGALLLIAAFALCLTASVAEAQPRPGGGGGDTPGITPRLPTTPLIGDDLPGGGTPGGPNRLDSDAPRVPDLLIAVFRPETPEQTSAAFAESLDLTIERRYELSGLRL